MRMRRPRSDRFRVAVLLAVGVVVLVGVAVLLGLLGSGPQPQERAPAVLSSVTRTPDDPANP